jgi:hypothetical protein
MDGQRRKARRLARNLAWSVVSALKRDAVRSVLSFIDTKPVLKNRAC